ncbi:hypothetical protein D3C72_1279020 [compost metagenome]
MALRKDKGLQHARDSFAVGNSGTPWLLHPSRRVAEVRQVVDEQVGRETGDNLNAQRRIFAWRHNPACTHCIARGAGHAVSGTRKNSA